MPTDAHEGFCTVFRNRPGLAVKAVRLLGRGEEVPDHTSITDVSENLSQLSTELRPDLLLLLRRKRRARLALVVEVQRTRDKRKQRSWPMYEVAAGFRYRCPSLLLIIAPDPRIARWAARPIPLGNGGLVKPLVLQPGQVPEVTDPARAVQNPELAVLSAMMHGRGEPALAVQIAVAAGYAASQLPEPLALLYLDFVESALGAQAKSILEKLMSEPGYEWKSDFARKHRGEGRAEGERAALQRQLSARFGPLATSVSERLGTATEQERQRWSLRILTAESLEQVFEA